MPRSPNFSRFARYAPMARFNLYEHITSSASQPPKDCVHHAFHVVEILLGFERIVNAVVSGLVKFLIAELWIVPKMGPPGRFDQAMRHQRSSGNDGIHDATIDQLGNHQSLFGTVIAPASVMTTKHP